MIQYKKGDRIKLLDDNIKGVVEKVEGDKVFVENSFGFLEEYHVSEILMDIDLEEDLPERKEGLIVEEIPKVVDKKIEKIPQARVESKKEIKKGPKKKAKKEPKPVLEIDLHYNKLELLNPKFNIDSILAKQMLALQERLERAREGGFDKVVVIHGKGEGVLENAVKEFCNERGYAFYDANYDKYQQGATVIELPKSF